MTAEIIDQASELEEMLRENAIAAHRINRNAVSAKHCESCGEDIPEPRRVAVPGCRSCASCLLIFDPARSATNASQTQSIKHHKLPEMKLYG